MFRARVVFNGSLQNEYPFYSIAKATEDEVVDMLDDMKPALVHAVSVQMQVSTDQPFPGTPLAGWKIIPSWHL